MPHAMQCQHDPLLMLLSYVIAVLGALTALHIVLALPRTPGSRRTAGLLGAGAALGLGGVWAMHFIAMLGCRLDVPVRYDIGTTALSAAIAWAASSLGFAVVGHRDGRPAATWAGGIVTGLGFAAMHYTGMMALHVPASVHYDPVRVAVSVAIAIAAALAALHLAFHPRTELRPWIAALVMGVAVCGLHYVGMAAVRWVPFTDGAAPVPAGMAPPWLGVLIFAVTAGGLAVALLVSRVRERRLQRG